MKYKCYLASMQHESLLLTSTLLSQQQLVFLVEKEVRFEIPYSEKKCPVILLTIRRQIEIIIL